MSVLKDVVCVFCDVAIEYNNVVDNVVVSTEPSKGFIHSTVVMFGNRRDAIVCAEVLKLAKWHDEGC